MLGVQESWSTCGEWMFTTCLWQTAFYDLLLILFFYVAVIYELGKLVILSNSVEFVYL